MAKLLALEWDAREARLVAARARGHEVTIEDVFSVDLASDSSDGAAAATSAGQRIAAALAARGVGRSEALVSIGRASIELQQMHLPPAPPEELPEMVRFQALRQFTTISEDWPLDFVTLDVVEGENVLAAAISPDMVAQIRATCAAAGLEPTRLVLRPFAASSLLCRQDRGGRQPPRLMVDLLTDEADLTVLVDERVALMRTVRLPTADESAVQTRALVGQMQRTIAAAHNQLHGRRIEKVILCGDGSDQAALKELVEQQLGQVVELFDPLAELNLADAQQQRPVHAGRFAPLIGMLLDETDGAAHAIDFLHPRKRPEPASTKRRNALIAATLAIAALAAVLLVWMQLWSLDAEIADMNAQLNQRKQETEEAESIREDVEDVRRFLSSDFTWLDEIYDLARDLPPADEAVVTKLNFAIDQGISSGGKTTVDVTVRQPEQLAEVHRALRADGRQVFDTGGQEFDRERYQWTSSYTALLEPVSPAKAAPATSGAATQPASEEADDE